MQSQNFDNNTTVENASSPLAVHRVLLIENADEDANRSEGAMREDTGWQPVITRVRGLTEAIRALMHQRFDVIVLEWQSTDAEGLPALAGVRGAAPGVPVVVYSRSVDAESVLGAIRAGATECVAKAHLAPEALGTLLVAGIERHRRMLQLHQACHEAAHRATHDPLTGIANRALFLDQLDRALALGARYQRKTGVLFIDLDGFKAVNDTRGHAAGDVLLREVANRLLGCVRRSDTVARLGGDEFVMLLPDVTSRRDMALVKEQVLELMQKPVVLADGVPVPLGVSIGTAMSPLDGVDAEVLLEAADADMYREKMARRRAVQRAPGDLQSPLQAPQIADSVTRRRETRLRQALERGEITVYFQPILDVVAEQVTAVEALIRWVTPEGLVLLPDQFLPLAEDTGLIVPMGEAVLRQACTALVRWRGARTAPASGLELAVNLSTVQLREHGFAASVSRILAETNCPAGAVTFEITEQQADEDVEPAFDALRALVDRGAHLCVDDFGVGRASLTFLRDAPVDAIKIDRRFVASLATDVRDQAIVSSLVRLSGGLGLRISAAGVEHTAQSQHLARLHCTRQQGWLFGAPLPIAGVDHLLSARPSKPAGPMMAAPPAAQGFPGVFFRRSADAE